MFCQGCGKELEPDANVCIACGVPAIHKKAESNEISEKAKAAPRSALATLRFFAIDPVGGLPSAFESLDKEGKRGVGVVFSSMFGLCSVIGAYLVFPSWGKPNIQGIFGLLLAAAIPPASIAGFSALARKAFKSDGSFEGDLYIAGASLLPIGIAVLLVGILSSGNTGIVAILAGFASCYTILILFSGCTKISKITEAKAALTVPVMLLLTAWFCKAVLTAML
jgi:hypothetical protein